MGRKNEGYGVQQSGDDPSPEQIRQQCGRIQDSWDAATERSRRTGSAEFVPFELPEVPARTFDE